MSDDRVDFRRLGPAFGAVPSWWSRFSSSDDVWAPDVPYHDGTYWMYYSVSGFGSNTSGIGLATSATGQPGTWVDSGAPILTSPYPGYDFNAIDPNLLVDRNGKWWLTLGSFRLGIHMVALAPPRTGKPSASETGIRHLAQRLHVWPDPVEAPFVFHKDGYYYLFVSFDYCCKGVNSNYSIHVGRSAAPDGPYVDQAGRAMVGDGGTLRSARTTAG
ncbi:arabinan endo-1,5-alpha-L-arabinosidase [Streptomyces huiliensis]|uniref:arabinan endo-1,5-alpha-L-arabinosidase n=1 Tax=Streptomyces huiliensis TaxID=2876027 RepID=UPI0027DEB8BE|nr:arabinan endo-1,5-alpha-L-arabinosidase [Streptomyces huiliensis]